MSNVRIRGRISTTTLKRGEERTVERTPQVDGLIREGYVTVVGGEKAAVEALPEPETPVDEPITAPSRSASKQDWRDFLDAVGIKFEEDLTRDELIALWTPEEAPTDG